MTLPVATYRVQLGPDFDLDDAAALADYVAELGASHLYTSPCLEAVPGSVHGYDVTDHGRVRAELGGEEALGRMVGALRGNGLRWVLDFVPNHMAITGRGNAWFWDVLENGACSPYALYFDVDWNPPEAVAQDRIVLPVLGDHYGRVLDRGEIGVEREEGSFLVRYFEHAFPVAPRSEDALLARAADRCGSEPLGFLAGALGQLPHATRTDAESVRRRHRDKEVLREQLARLLRDDPRAAEAVDGAVRELNGDPDALHGLLERQNYRLAFWRVAAGEVGFRRFFDINTLAGLRVEDERVFGESHRLALGWVREGALEGLRIDHPDGLRDPEGYLRRLREAAPDAWVVVEKILEPGEELPLSWPVGGTTGYDFLNLAGGLLVDPRGEAPLRDLHAGFTGEARSWPEVVREAKLLVLAELLGGDVSRLASQLHRICERHRRYRDYTLRELQDALRELVAAFPVYRTYVRPGAVREEDARRVGEAVSRAREARPDLDPELLSFLESLLLLRAGGDVEEDFALRFQQLTSPAMAKGVEDTACYRYLPLVALNEVGGDPGSFGTDPEAFHRAMARARPGTMLATSTHDTKRSEDVRARLSLLSEIPDRWAAAVERWSRLAARHKTGDAPDAAAEYLLYQTLVGAWPLDEARARAYMEKAAREAKTRTSWMRIDRAYEEALGSFVGGVLGDAEFLSDLAEFVRPLVRPGRVNSLSQTLLKLACPGVPDIYQGTELWDLSLVDPDNRRPVDFARRRGLLGEAMTAEEAMERAEEGLPKLFLIRKGLDLRRRRARAFEGPYEPLRATGPKAAHAVGLARGGEVLAVVPRLVLGLADDWGDTRIDLPDGSWRNVLTGERADPRLGKLLERFPVALLEREDA